MRKWLYKWENGDYGGMAVFLFLTVLWTGVIFSFSLQPSDVSADTSDGLVKRLIELFVMCFSVDQNKITPELLDVSHTLIRKCAHFTEFMILGILSEKTLLYTKFRNRCLVGIVFCVFIAMTDEALQLFVEGRAGRISDVLIDSIGAAVGVGLVLLIEKRLKR